MNMMRRVALPAWTLLVWVPRIRNIWVDEALSVPGQLLRTTWAVVFIGLAIGALWLAWRHARSAVGWWRVFVIWTVGFWVVRGVQIAVAGHDAGFVAVHTVLALVSIGLALWSWPSGREPDARTTPPVHSADHG
ncbi:MAG: hypothetical protein OES57_01705 [Acidimicrobiia bacterium]|nr:hypothetical protein [Acidimicrobiia bacterium]